MQRPVENSVFRLSDGHQATANSREIYRHKLPQMFIIYGVSLRHFVYQISVRQTVALFTCNTNFSAYLSNVTFLRATVAFSTAESTLQVLHTAATTQESHV